MDSVKKTPCFYDKSNNINILKIIKNFSCYFCIISFFIGLIEICLYFSTEKMFAAVDFNTLILGFFIGMIVFFKISIILIPVTAAAFYLFKFLSPQNSAFPLIFTVAISCFLASIFFDKSISPKSMIKHFSKGNYSASIILREEGCKILRECPFLKVTPQGTIENAKIFFKDSKLIYLNIDNKMITLSKELVLNEINRI